VQKKVDVMKDVVGSMVEIFKGIALNIAQKDFKRLAIEKEYVKQMELGLSLRWHVINVIHIVKSSLYY
jgi:lysozyme family protein